MRIVSCTRTEAGWQLLNLVDGWQHLGNERRAAEAWRAFLAVRAGAPVVTAGHTQFRIREADAA